MINHKLETLTILLILTIAVSAVPCVWAASTYSMTVSYSTSDKEPILEPPVLQYVDASGKSQDFTLTQTPTKIDMKKNSEWSITPKGTITVSASERWVSSNKTWSGKTPSSGGSDTNIWVYTHQYKVTFNVDPLKGGSTEPTGEVWYAADSSGNPLSASPNTNYAFKVWKATKSISIADPESSHTTFRVYGAGEITALFQTETAAAETALNITSTPTTVDTNGNMQTTLTGKLTLASNSNIGISGKTITLSYFDGASWNTMSTVATGVQGSYTYDWQVPTTLPYGFHPVKAAFAGDCQYEPQEAITTEGSEGIFVLPEYALGAFAALAACFAALTVFSVRKTKQ
jgi:hypothetical protein